MDEHKRSYPPSPLSAQNCYDYAHFCMDVWNSIDCATEMWWLRMADAWLQVARKVEERR